MKASLPPALWVAVGGASGSVLRWWMSGLVQRASGGTFPWGTFAVNALGSLAIGFLSALALERTLLSPSTRLFMITGVLGGFTTFSAYSYETVALLRDGHWGAAFGYAAGSVATGLACAFGGLLLGLKL